MRSHSVHLRLAPENDRHEVRFTFHPIIRARGGRPASRRAREEAEAIRVHGRNAMELEQLARGQARKQCNLAPHLSARAPRGHRRRVGIALRRTR